MQGGKLIEYLTFGRPREFAFSTLAGIGVLAFSFLGRDVIISVPENETAVIISSLVLGVVFLTGAFWALSSLGELTYSPRFHLPRHIAISFLVYCLLAMVLVTFGYAIFVFSAVGRMPNSAVELAVGGFFVSIITFVLAASHYRILKLTRKSTGKQLLVRDLLQTIDAICRNDHNDISKHTESLSSSLKELEQSLRNESIAECEDFRELVNECRVELSETTTSGIKKLFGKSAVFDDLEVVDSDPYWENQREDFEQLYKSIHIMRDSAMNKLNPRNGSDR